MSGDNGQQSRGRRPPPIVTNIETLTNSNSSSQPQSQSHTYPEGQLSPSFFLPHPPASPTYIPYFQPVTYVVYPTTPPSSGSYNYSPRGQPYPFAPGQQVLSPYAQPGHSFPRLPSNFQPPQPSFNPSPQYPYPTLPVNPSRPRSSHQQRGPSSAPPPRQQRQNRASNRSENNRPQIPHFLSNSSHVFQHPMINQASSSQVSGNPLPSNLSEDAVVELGSVLGRVYPMSQDQAGCKILQKVVKNSSFEEKELLFREVLHVFHLIMRDLFGNYFFQCLYENAQTELKRSIVSTVQPYIVEAALNSFGTRSIQCLINHSVDDLELYLMIKSPMIPNLYRVSTDRYGHHCVQQLLKAYPFEINQDIVQFLTSKWYELSINQYCNTVIQSCLRQYSDHTYELAQIICSQALALMQNGHGNYVIQCILHNFPTLKEMICRMVMSCFVPLSKDKCSSIVIQLCVSVASEEIQRGYTREILASGALLELALHKYSNYVIQEALSKWPLSLKSQLVDSLLPHRTILETSPSGQNIIRHLM